MQSAPTQPHLGCQESQKQVQLTPRTHRELRTHSTGHNLLIHHAGAGSWSLLTLVFTLESTELFSTVKCLKPFQRPLLNCVKSNYDIALSLTGKTNYYLIITNHLGILMEYKTKGLSSSSK